MISKWSFVLLNRLSLYRYSIKGFEFNFSDQVTFQLILLDIVQALL